MTLNLSLAIYDFHIFRRLIPSCNVPFLKPFKIVLTCLLGHILVRNSIWEFGHVFIHRF